MKPAVKMAISLLWKLPLLLTAPFAAHVATTPPTPPARADEQARFGYKDSISYLPRYFTLAGTVRPRARAPRLPLPLTLPSGPRMASRVRGGRRDPR